MQVTCMRYFITTTHNTHQILRHTVSYTELWQIENNDRLQSVTRTADTNVYAHLIVYTGIQVTQGQMVYTWKGKL